MILDALPSVGHFYMVLFLCGHVGVKLMALKLERFFLIIEFLFFLSVSVSFCLVYICFFDAPMSVFLPHVLAIFSCWLFLFGIRVANWRFGWFLGRSVQRLIGGALFVLPMVFLVFWYCAALFGLASWGRVITWPLVKTYFFQFEHFVAVLGASVSVAVVMGLIFVLGLILLVLKSYRIDGARMGADFFSKPAVFMVFFMTLALGVAQFLAFPINAEKNPRELFSASFFSAQASGIQSHVVSVSPLVTQAEDLARNTYRASPVLQRRNVILIVGDALRSAHMSVYGYSRRTTPFLKKSAGEFRAHVFPKVRSVCAESFCGLLGLATSRYLHQIPDRPLSLYEVLRKNNYNVSLVLSGDHTTFYGLKNAYGEVDSYFDGTHQQSRYINDDELLVDYVRSLPVYDGLQPRLFQFHLMSTHGIGLRHSENLKFLPMANYYGWSAGRILKAPSKRAVSEAINYYDNGVLQFDRIVESLLGQLSAKGYLENAVIVITGDHGEMLGEKGFFGHQYHTDEEVLDIPLIVLRRGYMGQSFADWPLVSQVDVAPTILRELNIEPPEVWRGVALQGAAVSRDVYFQQAPSAGLYSVPLRRPIVKYSSDFSTGDESVDILEEGEMSGSSGEYAPFLEEWRRNVKETAVLGRDAIK